MFQLYQGENEVNFQWDDDKVCFGLDQHAQLDLYSASSLKHQSADRHVAALGSIILIPNQPVFDGSLHAACLAEKQQIPVL
jgi:xanthine dehydrogenase molybdopterin-binding subunit B